MCARTHTRARTYTGMHTRTHTNARTNKSMLTHMQAHAHTTTRTEPQPATRTQPHKHSLCKGLQNCYLNEKYIFFMYKIYYIIYMYTHIIVFHFILYLFSHGPNSLSGPGE